MGLRRARGGVEVLRAEAALARGWRRGCVGGEKVVEFLGDGAWAAHIADAAADAATCGAPRDPRAAPRRAPGDSRSASRDSRSASRAKRKVIKDDGGDEPRAEREEDDRAQNAKRAVGAADALAERSAQRRLADEGESDAEVGEHG